MSGQLNSWITQLLFLVIESRAVAKNEKNRSINFLFPQYRRLFGHRRLQTETDSRPDMDFDSALLDLHAHVGWRRRRRQRCHAEAETDALDSVESAGSANHKLHFRLERWPRGGRSRRCGCTWSLPGLARLESQGCGAERVRSYGPC